MKLFIFITLFIFSTGITWYQYQLPLHNVSLDKINLTEHPVSAEQALDFASDKKEQLCLDKAKMQHNSREFERCIQHAQRFTYMCKNRIIKDMPEQINNDISFEKFTSRMM